MDNIHNLRVLFKKKLLQSILGTLTFASFSFYNGFPFINGDTSAYLNAAYEASVPYERPVFYGWFLRIFSLQYSLWLSILVQCLICFWVLREAILGFTSVRGGKMVFFVTFLTLFLTQVGWEANKLLPDVFAGLAMVLILLYLECKTPRARTYLIMLIILGTFHNTHFLLYSGIAVLFLVASIWRSFYSRTKLVVVLGVGILSFSLVSLSNYIDHGSWNLGRSSEVFMVGQMSESGLLLNVLCDHCESKKWSLCTYKDSLPVRGWMYVWNANSPVAKLGGWDAMKDEHKDILETTYTSPKYYPKLVVSSLVRGFSNCLQLDAGDGIFRNEHHDNIQRSIQKYYPVDLPSARWTKQFILTIPFKSFTIWYLVVLGLLILSFLYTWESNMLTSAMLSRIIFCLATIFINGWIVAQFANISDRLNTRVFWILPFFMILALIEQLALNHKIKS